jgi:hypothetical protein
MATQALPAELGARATDFALKDVHGQLTKLADVRSSSGVAAWQITLILQVGARTSFSLAVLGDDGPAHFCRLLCAGTKARFVN